MWHLKHNSSLEELLKGPSEVDKPAQFQRQMLCVLYFLGQEAVTIIHHPDHQTAIPFSHVEMPAKIDKRGMFFGRRCTVSSGKLALKPDYSYSCWAVKKKKKKKRILAHLFFLKLTLNISFFAKKSCSFSLFHLDSRSIIERGINLWPKLQTQ